MLTTDQPSNSPPSADTIQRIINRLGLALRIPIELGGAGSASQEDIQPIEPLRGLIVSAKHSGIVLKQIELESVEEAFAFVREGYPLLLARADGSFVVLQRIAGRKLEVSEIAERSKSRALSRRQLRQLLAADVKARVFVAKKQLECDSLSAAPMHAHGRSHEHPTPMKRFQGLLNLDRRDILTVFLFAFVAGILALATPLAIESLVNVVSWGTYIQPLLVLGLMLLTCLGLAGVLKVLQTVVVEIIQRRQFVRIVNDLAHRFPRAQQSSLVGHYPRELANRIFEIMTIQKSTAVLLLDGVTIVLTTLLGMVLLAFYHPFLLGFDIVLLLSMLSIMTLLGRGGVRTAIDESITKYRVVHWLQDVLASPSAFKINGGEALAIQRANQLTAQYIEARQTQFRVVIRQVVFAIGLQVIASTALLGLGGWLVIQGQLTLGQLVASELVVTVVVGAFAKAGKSLEKFYDLMAGIDKVGHLLDIPADPVSELGNLASGPAAARWGELFFQEVSGSSRISAASVAPGARVAIVGDDVHGRSQLAKALAGMVEPCQGVVEVAGLDAGWAAAAGKGRLVAYAGACDVFCGSLRENVDLGRSSVGHDRVREALAQVGLADTVLKLPDGLQTALQTGGFPLSPPQVQQLLLARAIAALPKLLVIDGLLDMLSSDVREIVWKTLAAEDAPWTLLVVTNRSDIAKCCDTQVAVRTT